MVPSRGVEPPPCCQDTDLNRARLPVPPRRHRAETALLGRGRGDAARTPRQARVFFLNHPLKGLDRPLRTDAHNAARCGGPSKASRHRFPNQESVSRAQ